METLTEIPDFPDDPVKNIERTVHWLDLFKEIDFPPNQKYGIWVPTPIARNQELKAQEKLLLGLLGRLMAENDQIIANNNWFQRYFDVTKRAIQYYLATLEDEQFIERENSEHRARGRIITPGSRKLTRQPNPRDKSNGRQ